TQRVQRRSLTEDNRGESCKRKHQRRANHGSVSTDSEGVGPNDSRGQEELKQPAFGESSHDQKHKPADEADVQTTDYENVKSSTVAKAFGCVMRKVVPITQQRCIKHTSRLGLESGVNL